MNSEQITIPIEMEITKTMLTLASYDLINTSIFLICSGGGVHLIE